MFVLQIAFVTDWIRISVAAMTVNQVCRISTKFAVFLRKQRVNVFGGQSFEKRGFGRNQLFDQISFFLLKLQDFFFDRIAHDKFINKNRKTIPFSLSFERNWDLLGRKCVPAPTAFLIAQG